MGCGAEILVGRRRVIAEQPCWQIDHSRIYRYPKLFGDEHSVIIGYSNNSDNSTDVPALSKFPAIGAYQANMPAFGDQLFLVHGVGDSASGLVTEKMSNKLVITRIENPRKSALKFVVQ